MQSDRHLEVIWAIWPFWANTRMSKTTKRLLLVSCREFRNSKATLVMICKKFVSRSAMRNPFGGHLGDLAIMGERTRVENDKTALMGQRWGILQS